MSTGLKSLCGILVLASSMVMTAAFAHQQKESYTTLLFNKRSGNVEVSHRFSVHDAEHALKVLFNVSGELATDAEYRAAFAAYVDKNFSISAHDGSSLKLSEVGYEVDAKYFWLYQEMPIPQTVIFQLSHSALFDVWPSQINYINVEKDGWVRSARLTRAENLQTISLANE